MKNYNWWKKQKKRVQKKYTLLMGRYLSPKELKEWYKEKGELDTDYLRGLAKKGRTK